MPAISVETQNDNAPADLEWTPQMQLATTLSLCEAQMESALQESDQAVDELINIFRALAEATQSLNSLTEATSQGDGAIPRELEEKVNAASRHVTAAVVAFQFYDKLTQRVGHVRYSLSTLAQFVCDPNQSGQPEQWRRLLNTLRRLYRTEEERQVFQMMTEGTPLEDTREQGAVVQAETGTVELF